MEFDENNEVEVQEEDGVEIYSRRAVLGFSIFPSPLFGGILLMINLRSAGYKRPAYIVLIFSLLYIIATNIVLSTFFTMPKQLNPAVIDPNILIMAGASIAANLIGGLILSFYFFKKYFPDNDYYPKSIVTPLLIAVAMIFVAGYMGL